MAAGVGTRLRGAGTASNHRAGSSGDFWRRQRLLRDAPARRLQREGPTRTQFPPAAARIAPGDSVVLTFLTCGRCKPCRLGRMAHCEKTFPLCFGGARLDGSTATFDGQGEKVHDHFFGQSSFATYALANERNVVKVSSDVPLERLGPLGCGNRSFPCVAPTKRHFCSPPQCRQPGSP